MKSHNLVFAVLLTSLPNLWYYWDIMLLNASVGKCYFFIYVSNHGNLFLFALDAKDAETL